MVRRLALFFFLSFFATSVWAQSSQPSDKRAAAEAAVGQAQAAYAAQDYPKALASFEEAYRLYPVPALLFNIAQCYRLMGQDEEALKNYKRFLSEQPDTPYAAEVQGRIKELEEKLAVKPTPSGRSKLMLPLAIAGVGAVSGGVSLGVGFSTGAIQIGPLGEAGCTLQPGQVECPGSNVVTVSAIIADASFLIAGGLLAYKLLVSPRSEKTALSISPSRSGAVLTFTYSGF